jgi:hypothetical protein
MTGWDYKADPNPTKPFIFYVRDAYIKNMDSLKFKNNSEAKKTEMILDEAQKQYMLAEKQRSKPSSAPGSGSSGGVAPIVPTVPMTPMTPKTSSQKRKKGKGKK